MTTNKMSKAEAIAQGARLVDEEDCPCFYNATCPTDYVHEGDE